MTVKKEDLEKRLTYTLKKPHTHDGVDYTQEDVDEGVDIELSAERAQALQDQGIIEHALILKEQGVVEDQED